MGVILGSYCKKMITQYIFFTQIHVTLSLRFNFPETFQTLPVPSSKIAAPSFRKRVSSSDSDPSSESPPRGNSFINNTNISLQITTLGFKFEKHVLDDLHPSSVSNANRTTSRCNLNTKRVLLFEDYFLPAVIPLTLVFFKLIMTEIHLFQMRSRVIFCQEVYPVPPI